MKMTGLIIVVSLLVSAQLCWTDNVPVFIWSSLGTAKLPDVYAGHELSRYDFAGNYLSRILGGKSSELEEENDGKNIVIVLQDELNVNEIARSADVFNSSSHQSDYTNLKKVMTVHESIYLHSVASAYDVVSNLGSSESDESGERTLTRKVLQSPYIIPKSLESGQTGSSNLFLIEIPDSASHKEIDDIIGSVDQQLHDLGKPFSIIYTPSHAASQDPMPMRKADDMSSEEEDPNVNENDPSSKTVGTRRSSTKAAGASGTRRKLLQYFPSYFTFVNLTNCVYLYAQNITLSVLGYAPWTLPLNPEIDPTSYCYNYSAELKLVYGGIDDTLKGVNLTMIFGVTQGLEAGYWYMPNFTVSYTIYNSTLGTTQTTSYDLFPYFVTETPYSFSYSCYYPPPISPLGTMDWQAVKPVNVTFIGLQLQAFNITNNEFGYYNDCVGFFTIMTWACLFIIFIMAGILFFAACMFAGLSTPTRYDDPHGKTIVVNTVD